MPHDLVPSKPAQAEQPAETYIPGSALETILTRCLERVTGPSSRTPRGRQAAPDEPSRTPRDVFDWYVKSGQCKACPLALKEHRRIWEVFCDYCGQPDECGVPFGLRSCTELKPYHLLRFIGHEYAHVANWTRRRVASSIRTPMSAAVRLGFLERNPFAEPLRLPMGKRGRDWNDEEYAALLRNSQPFFRRLLVFLRVTGARPGEARKAQWSQVDFDARVIVLNEHKTAHCTQKPRRINLNHVALKLLRWMERQPDAELSPFLFLNGCSGPWTTRASTNHMNLVRSRAGLPKSVKLHGGRHTYITRALANGVPLATVAALVDHSSTNTTEIYTHLVDQSDHLKDAAEWAIGCNPQTAAPSQQHRAPAPRKVRSSYRVCYEAARLAFNAHPELADATDAELFDWLSVNSAYKNLLPQNLTAFSRLMYRARLAYEGVNKQCRPLPSVPLPGGERPAAAGRCAVRFGGSAATQRLHRAQELAYLAHLWAVAKNPELQTAADRQVYEFLRGNRECPYPMPPAFATYARYLGAARLAHDTRKRLMPNSRPAGGV